MVRRSDRTPSLAFAVPRKVGGAVIRNRLRRQLREVLRSFEVEGAVPGGEYLLVVAPGAAGAGYGQLHAWVGSMLDDLRRTS